MGMADESHRSELFISLRRTAGRLGVPAAWLRAEVKAGRIPCLQIGKRMLLNPKAVEHVLLVRAQRAHRKGAAHG